MSLLVKCGWTNVGNNDRGYESTRKWRNNNIAEYLKVDYQSDSQLAADLFRKLPRLRTCLALLKTHTGITHYYKPFRPETLAFVKNHSAAISDAFALASSRRITPVEKVGRIMNLILALGPIHVGHVEVSPLNALTPTLACLDPLQRTPIINHRTKRLLRAIQQYPDVNGALELSQLIGSCGLRNAFELDVYASTADFTSIERPRKLNFGAKPFKDLGIKSEIASHAKIAANRSKVTRLHNALTNRFRDWLKWRYLIPKESRFDAVLLDWKKDRHLLIEAKTSSTGPTGRMHIRQAIGQLLDYRYIYSSSFPPGEVDLAVLVPTKPSLDIQRFLNSLGIETLWFEHTQVRGTIKL